MRCSLHGNRAADAGIEEGDLLSKACLEIFVADITSDVVCGKREERTVSVRDDKSADPNEEEIEPVSILPLAS